MGKTLWTSKNKDRVNLPQLPTIVSEEVRAAIREAFAEPVNDKRIKLYQLNTLESR